VETEKVNTVAALDIAVEADIAVVDIAVEADIAVDSVEVS
jgi:hypothetical protein